MKEKDGHFEIELSDVLEAKDLGTDHIVNDWPWGSRQRCIMHFSVDLHPTRGERFVKQSTLNGRAYKPKKATYATRIKIIELDGKIGHVEYHRMYCQFGINIEDGKYWSKTFFGDEALQLYRHFFT